MKRFAVLAVLLLLVAASAFAVNVDGKYKVSFRYSCTVITGKGNSGEGVEPVIEIWHTAEDKVSIKLPPFIFSEDKAFGYMTIQNVEVSEGKKGEVKFSLKDYTATDGVTEVIGSSVSGTLKDGILELKVKYKIGKMPFDITVKYTNEK